jgi:glycosyltransferase involved in cell wall biosynthesis
LDNSFFRKVDKHIYKFYKSIVCISVEIKEILIRHTGLPLYRFVVINNGINLKDIYNASPVQREKIHGSLKPDDKILIQVAGFRKQKDQTTLIRALNLLPENVKLLLVGDGILKKECESLAIKLNLQKRVFFLGLRMDVPQLLKSSDIVVMSSNWEGFGLAAVEGMAAGKPVLASNVPGLAKVVEGAGVLFPVGDYVELSKLIQEFLAKPAYYQTVLNACQQRAESYDIHKMVNQLVELYEGAIKN